MTTNDVLQITIFFLAISPLTKPMGVFMATLFEGRRTRVLATLSVSPM